MKCGQAKPMTSSEKLFERYCEWFGITCNKIPTTDKESPDYEVNAGGQRLIVEIKEQSPNSDDRNYYQELCKNGIAELTPKRGRRINSHIKKAVDQLRGYADRRIPLVLLIHDNLRIEGHSIYVGRNHFLKDEDFDKGMYGDTGNQYTFTSSRDLPIVKQVRISPRQLGAHRNEHLSAVGVLCEREDGGVFVYIYHNYFAAVPLPPTVFTGLDDRTFRKPSEPTVSLRIWREERNELAAE